MSQLNVEQMWNLAGTRRLLPIVARMTFQAALQDNSATEVNPPVISGNVGFSSITRNDVGVYTFNFSAAMPNRNYSVATCAMRASSNYGGIMTAGYWGTPTTTSFSLRFFNTSTYEFPQWASVMVTGDA